MGGIHGKVFIIGLDGATWDVLLPWMEEGVLPHLRALWERGAWGKLASTLPPLTAPAWTTFMTGKNPGKHGVFHFVKGKRQPGTPSPSPPAIVNARSIQSPTLWDILSHHGLQVGVINVPMTYPPRPLNGFMITGLLTPPNAEVFTYPPELARDLVDYKVDLDRFIHHKPFAQARQGTQLIEPSLELVAEYRDLLERRRRNTLTLMQTRPWDVLMVVIAGTDRLGHYLWPYHRAADLDGSPQSQALHQAVRDYYVQVDQTIGEWVAAAGEEVTVLLMSDHGMGPVYSKHVHLNQWLREEGLLVLEQRRANLTRPDFWLARLGIPRDKLGRLVRSIPGLARSRVVQKARHAGTATIDMRRTAAYYVPIYVGTGGIYINVKGEDGQGVVSPGEEYEALREHLLHRLSTLTDPETGRPVVVGAWRGEICYHGPYATDIPDIVVLLDAPYSGSDRLSHYSALVTPRVGRANPGDHRQHGIFMATGPVITPSREPLEKLSLQDIAPTVLYLLGLPVPSDMDGRVILEMVSPHFRDAHPVTYGEPGRFWGEDLMETTTTGFSAEDEALLRERLSALGYLE